LRVQLTPQQVQRGATLTLQSDTWNPENTTPDNPRDEDLGLRVETLAFQQQGHPLEVREALPIPTVERDRRELWLWYYDSPKHHLFDAWLWFVFVAGLPPAIVGLLLVLVALPASLMVGLGLRGVVEGLRESAV
jgi:hypothetical protein